LEDFINQFASQQYSDRPRDHEDEEGQRPGVYAPRSGWREHAWGRELPRSCGVTRPIVLADFFSAAPRVVGDDTNSMHLAHAALSIDILGQVTHHLIKFHPMDEEYVSEWPPFWNFRKERPPVQKWKGKKKVSDMEQVEPERETGDWKWPWMISRQDDHEFEKAFIARREKEERSSNSILIHCTLGGALRPRWHVQRPCLNPTGMI